MERSRAKHLGHIWAYPIFLTLLVFAIALLRAGDRFPHHIHLSYFQVCGTVIPVFLLPFVARLSKIHAETAAVVENTETERIRAEHVVRRHDQSQVWRLRNAVTGTVDVQSLRETLEDGLDLRLRNAARSHSIDGERIFLGALALAISGETTALVSLARGSANALLFWNTTVCLGFIVLHYALIARPVGYIHPRERTVGFEKIEGRASRN